MKILILSLLLSFNLFAQHPLLTLFDGAPPAIPTGLSAVGDTSKITLTWDAQSVDSFYIYRGTSTDPTTLLYTVAGNTTTKIDATLAGGTIYYYRMKSKKGGLTSLDYSSNVSDTVKYKYTIIETSNFAAGLDSYAGNAGTWGGNVDGIWGVDDVLRGYGHVNARFYKAAGDFDVVGGLHLDTRYCVRFDYYQTAVSAAAFQFSEWDLGTFTTFLTIPSTSPQVINDQWASIDTSFVFTFVNATDGSGLRIYTNPLTVNDTTYIKNIKIYKME